MTTFLYIWKYICIYIYILIFIDIFSYMQMGTCIFICNYKYLSLCMCIYIYLYQYCKFGGVLLIRTRLINIITPGHTHWHAAVQMNGKFSALGWIQYFLYWVGFGLKIDLDEQMHIFCTKTWENTSMPALRPWMSWGMVVLWPSMRLIRCWAIRALGWLMRPEPSSTGWGRPINESVWMSSWADDEEVW